MRDLINRKVIYMLYGVCLILLIAGLFFFSRKPKTTLETPFAVMDVLEKIKLPVVKESDTIIGRPYTENKVSIVQSYYDYKANESEQTNSIIYYQDTYIQNCGISYSNDGEPFDVVAVLDGEVIEVKQDTLLGNIIKIKHSESVMSVYQSIGDINVAVGDNVVKGTVLATSSTSNIRSTLNNHLYFELLIDGINVNPEEYYDKSL
jgi:stage II sporulation protein Q